MKNKSPKIIYVLGTRFPTDKAYGVTTRETLEALGNLHYQTKLLCNKSNYFDKDFMSVYTSIENFEHNILSKNLVLFGEKGTNILHKLAWKFGLLINILISFKTIEEFTPNIIWLRDPFIALLYAIKFKDCKIFLEIHEKRQIFILKRLINFSDQIIFLPINKINYNVLRSISRSFNMLIAPMGVPDSHIITDTSCRKFVQDLKKRKNKKINVGYFGKISPNGYSKGIQDLIKLAQRLSTKGSFLSVSIVGATKKDLFELEKWAYKLGISSSYLQIRAHLSHSLALKLMHKFDVLILPEYLSKDYNGMPIKLIEYLASGRITVIASTPLYKSFFSEDFFPFFYISGNHISLEDTILQALKFPKLDDKLIKGVHFASQFTWQNRTNKILEHYFKAL